MKTIAASEIKLRDCDEISYSTGLKREWQCTEYCEYVTIKNRYERRGVKAKIFYLPGTLGPFDNSRVFPSLRKCLEWIGCQDAIATVHECLHGGIIYDLGTIDFRF